MLLPNMEIDDEKLNRDVDTINQYPMDLLAESIPELAKIKMDEMYFSKNKLSEKRLVKISKHLFIIFKLKTMPIILPKLYTITEEYDLNNRMKITKELGIAFGILTKICVGNLICDSNDNPFRELYKKHILDITK